MDRGNNNRKIGQKYEQLAENYLKNKGYEILCRNYCCPYGEIDIIAKQGDYLVFIEVKYRKSNGYGTPGEAVNVKKQRHISRAALSYYAAHGYREEIPCRFDVIEVNGKNEMIQIENAFDYLG